MSRHKQGCGMNCSKPQEDQEEKKYVPRVKKARGVYHEKQLRSEEPRGRFVASPEFVGRDVLIYHPKTDTQQMVQFPRGERPPGHFHVLWDADIHAPEELKRILERRKEIKHRGYGLAPHQVKGSKAAKEHMAKLRSLRKR